MCAVITLLLLGGATEVGYLLYQHFKPVTPLTPAQLGLMYMGAKCDTITAHQCYPLQLPNYADQTYEPQVDKFLILTEPDLDVEMKEARVSDISANLFKTASAESSSASKSFGLSVWGIAEGIPFSLSRQHQTMMSTMHSYNHEQFYAETQQTFILFSVSLRNNSVSGGNFTLQPSFKSAIEELPRWNPDDSQATEEWYNFFSVWGTHYTKSANFGGKMKMTAYIETDATSDTKTDETQWGLYLQAGYAEAAGASFDMSRISNETDYNEWKQFQFTGHMHVVGGDVTRLHFEDWVQSVNDNPALIETILAPLSDFSNDEDSFDSALKSYYQVCPHKKDGGGICNGLGTCNTTDGTCSCNEGTYEDEDRTCFIPLCLNGDLDNNGRCICHMDAERRFGWTGDDCSQPCGKHTYHAASDSEFPTTRNTDPATHQDWRIATTWNSDYFLADTDADATCWCKHVLSKGGFYDSDDLYNLEGYPLDTSSHWENTRHNCGEDQFCHANPVNKCRLVNTVDCRFNHEECGNNVIVVPTPANRVGPRAINASLDARAEPVQRFAVV